MEVYDACMKRRSVRKFEHKEIGMATLMKLVDSGRMAPSGANVQPIEYLIVDEQIIREKLFLSLKWAGYIAPKGNPLKGEEPTAYIVMLINTKIKEANYQYDVGAAAENIALCAVAEGLASCMLGAIDRDRIREQFKIPEYYVIDLVIALGYPKEHPIIEELKESVRYYKDERGVLHVPKRRLKDIMHVNRL
ncbi:MAG: nitroreductase family protein [Candidatus Woesearchaeota archaeon]